MSTEELTPDAVQEFRAQLRAGDMVGAFGTIKRLPIESAVNLMLRAGFSVAYDRGSTRAFWERTQSDIVRACRQHTDGYGLRPKNSL
ncbi:hypothetical protein [Burkholderia multivorans]|uniref:hypothetical protein n=1 Tax=Burkholderia multivorans TaxID=87883 RepID=UPI0009B8F449|nr:hypothetical protein [Burkholderia multivorans]MDR9230291.1 hypothetical protein [Burkholderia multivorans]HDR9474964.1 hypothetical protein [Burkholderia multivorans]HDR9480775.1 hypothetical protein [Burkholderia multivorans]